MTIASSLPIICSDFSVFKEILKKNTLYFDPLDQTDIANKILHYIENYKLRKKNTIKLRNIAKTVIQKSRAIYEDTKRQRELDGEKERKR